MKKINLKLPRGIRDIPPEIYNNYLWLFDKFREMCLKYNFKIMEPATLEFFETLALKSGSDIAKEIYEFKDKAGRHLGLRFDLTVGLTRYVTMHPDLPKPVRLAAYSIQWRYDEPQYGRYRSFYAWDIEIYGGEELFSAAETILFVNNFLSDLGLKNYAILISDRRLIEEIIRYYSPNADIEAILRALDKWGKLEKEGIIKLITEAGGKNVDDMLNLLFNATKQELISIVSKYGGGMLENLFSLLENDLNLNNVKFDPSIVRGLDYYDGIIFEVREEKGYEIGSIVGGGNYSKLVNIFGDTINAFGAAGGVERLLLALKKEGIKIMLNKLPLVIVIPLDYKYINLSLKIAEKLRESLRLVVESPIQFRSLRKSLYYANKIGADYAVFLGEHESSQDKVTLKNLKTRQEYFVTIPEAINIIESAF